MDDGVRLAVESRRRGTEVLTAAQVVVTAGGWTEKLLGAAVGHGPRLRIPQLRVTQEQPAHFRVTDAGPRGLASTTTRAPGGYTSWYSPVYGMQTPGEGIKAGWHGVGPVVDPDRRSFLPEPRAARRPAGLRADTGCPAWTPTPSRPISCTYTTTPDEDFVLDRIGPVVIGAGFSGHGFKFTPVVGRILADLATGTREAPAIFSASR